MLKGACPLSLKVRGGDWQLGFCSNGIDAVFSFTQLSSHFRLLVDECVAGRFDLLALKRRCTLCKYLALPASD